MWGSPPPQSCTHEQGFPGGAQTFLCIPEQTASPAARPTSPDAHIRPGLSDALCDRCDPGSGRQTCIKRRNPVVLGRETQKCPSEDGDFPGWTQPDTSEAVRPRGGRSVSLRVIASCLVGRRFLDV